MFKQAATIITKTVNVESEHGDTFFDLHINPKTNSFHIEQPTVTLQNISVRALHESMLYENLHSRIFNLNYHIDGRLRIPEIELIRVNQVNRILSKMTLVNQFPDDLNNVFWFHSSGVYLRVEEPKDREDVTFIMYANGRQIDTRDIEYYLSRVLSLLMQVEVKVESNVIT